MINTQNGSCVGQTPNPWKNLSCKHAVTFIDSRHVQIESVHLSAKGIKFS